MTCPNCRQYPINHKSKHKLCIKCGYEAARMLAKKRREEATPKLTLEDRLCPSCKEVFSPKYKDHKYCGIECQKKMPTKIKNASWMEKKRKTMKSKDAVNIRIRRRKNKFNRFENKGEEDL